MTLGPVVLIESASADFDEDDNLATFSGNGSAPIVVVRGDLGGGTIALVMRSSKDPIDDRWIELDTGTFTAEGQKSIDPVPDGIQIRATLTGATAPSNVFIAIHYQYRV